MPGSMYNVCIWIGRFLHGQLLGPDPGGGQVRIPLLDVLSSGVSRFIRLDFCRCPPMPPKDTTFRCIIIRGVQVNPARLF